MSGDLARDEVTPFPKTIQTARRTKKYRRKVASSKQWAGLIAERQGPCRLCGSPPPNDMHHLIPRDRGGGDVAENLIPLCRSCHSAVEAREQQACTALVASTWLNQPEPGPHGGAQDEYSFACEAAGDDWPERVYGIRYVPPAAPLAAPKSERFGA